MYNQAKTVLNEFQINVTDESFEYALEAINKFGSAKNVILEGLKPEYKYLTRLSKLLAIIDEKKSFDEESEKISSLMYDIYRTVSKDSESKGEDFMKLLSTINVRKTFNPSDMELWVMNYIGGRKLISKITYQEPNQLQKKILDAIAKYRNLSELSTDLAIENKDINNLYITQ